MGQLIEQILVTVAFIVGINLIAIASANGTPVGMLGGALIAGAVGHLLNRNPRSS